MPSYEVRWAFKDTAIKALTDNPHDREPAARELIEGFGGKLHHYYFTFGEYDGLAIVEFPDNVSVAAMSMRAGSTGAFTKFETHPLLTTQEAKRAMEKVRDTKVNYRPPHA
jgi:uncharacterized protein with GYD domain